MNNNNINPEFEEINILSPHSSIGDRLRAIIYHTNRGEAIKYIMWLVKNRYPSKYVISVGEFGDHKIINDVNAVFIHPLNTLDAIELESHIKEMDELGKNFILFGPNILYTGSSFKLLDQIFVLHTDWLTIRVVGKKIKNDLSKYFNYKSFNNNMNPRMNNIIPDGVVYTKDKLYMTYVDTTKNKDALNLINLDLDKLDPDTISISINL